MDIFRIGEGRIIDICPERGYIYLLSSTGIMAITTRKLRILIVDDEPLVSKSIRLLLQADGHDVTIADSAGAALEAVTKRAFDLVVTDYYMPVMSGDRLAVAIKQKFPDLPVIMVTAFAYDLRRDKHPLQGVDKLLGKPFGRADLQEAVAEVCC